MGCSPWGRTESDTTGDLAAAAVVCIYLNLNQSGRLHNCTLFTLKVVHSYFNNVDNCAAVHLNNLVLLL